MPRPWRPLLPALLFLALAAFALAACGDDDAASPASGNAAAAASSPRIGGDLILATTTSVQDSGLLDTLAPLFEARTGVTVKVIAVGTGAALQMGEEGNADALLVHAPASEQALVDAGHVINRHLIAYNDFLLVGPDGDPAGIAGTADAVAAFQAIAATQSRFISRGDDSGTHKKELSIWKAAAIDPAGGWYEETGQGMGASLTIANQKNAYILTDRATFLAQSRNLALVPLVEHDPLFLNLYSVMQVNPDKGNINAEAAAAWVDFLQSAEVQALIQDFRRDEFGQSLFVPAAGLTEEQAARQFAAGG